MLFDPVTKLADLGVGGWHDPGGPLLNGANDGAGAHRLDVVAGDGVRGYGRGSSLPALGGALRIGELSRTIRHALAINVYAVRLSAAPHFVWPASSADSSADFAYQGTNPRYAMGTLLAIPRSVRLGASSWRTRQGRNLARAAQRYGWYIVDSLPPPGDLVQFGIDNDAAREDLGLAIDPATGNESVDPAKVDIEGLNADVVRILGLVSAVTSNGP